MQDPSWHRLVSPFRTDPVHTEEHPSNLLTTKPLAPLLFENLSSDARDHCANERTFLSQLRLATYMAVVSIALIVSFHLKNQPTELERKFGLPFGIVFWLLSLACLANGFANYLNAVKKFANRRALVQSGWKTQIVFIIVAITIVAACILLLSTERSK